MRTLAVTVVTMLGLAACSEEPPQAPATDSAQEPSEVTLTLGERADFVDRIGRLGFTCREALPDDHAFVACTRPGVEATAVLDTVRLTAGPDGEVVRVSYCGFDEALWIAFSDTFLPEIGSPARLPQPDETRGAPLRECAGGAGFSAGAEVAAQPSEIDLVLVRSDLGDAGWQCDEDSILTCIRGREDAPAVAWATIREIGVSGRPAEVSSALTALGVGPEAIAEARACSADAPCEHLVVDGYDITMTVDDDDTVVVLRATSWS